MKVILAHPGQQHSFKVAAALKKSSYLGKYITAVYDKDDNYAMRLARKLVRGNDINKIANRKCIELDDEDVKTYYSFLSLVVIILSRNKKTKKMSSWLDRKISNWFGIKVAKYAIKNNADIVMCFSTNETTCFEYLKKHAPHIKRIVDYANPPWKFMTYVFDNDCYAEQLKKEVPYYWDKKNVAIREKGQQLTDFFIAPSTFVKKGLQYCGVDESQIKVIPYGTNFEVCNNIQKIPTKVKFVYVGNVNYQKGVKYLLDAFCKYERLGIELNVVGAYDNCKDIYDQYSGFSNIHFYGRVNHDEVKSILLSSNVFVFPALAEGMSLACLEALSCGLPLLCSFNAGANDVICNGKNGFVFEYNDKFTLEEKVLWFYNNPQSIPEFSKQALETARSISWEFYQENLKKELKKIMGN